MSVLRAISQKALLLVLFLTATASLASASTLSLVNGPIALLPTSAPPHSITSVVFSNASFQSFGGPNMYLDLLANGSGQAGFATVDTLGTANTADDIVYNLFLHPDHTLFSRAYEFVPASSAYPNVFLQNGGSDPVIVFYTDQPGSSVGTFLTVEITNSWLDMNTLTWSIAAEAGSGGPPVCTSVCPATWKFFDAGTELETNATQMDLQLTASVPEPSAIYLLAIGLGLGSQLIRRTRQ